MPSWRAMGWSPAATGARGSEDCRTWPTVRCGRARTTALPYTLVAQIDCSAPPPSIGDFTGPEGRHGGALVRIFAALYGVPEHEPALALACAPDAPVARAPVPHLPDPMPTSGGQTYEDSLRELAETPVKAVPFLTVPHRWYVLPEDARETPVTAGVP